MSKRTLPKGTKCVKVMISATPGQLERLDRLAAEARRRGRLAYASRSGAIRADEHAARLLRHDLRQPLNALVITEQLLRAAVAAADVAALAALVDQVHRSLAEITAVLSDPAAPLPIRLPALVKTVAPS